MGLRLLTGRSIILLERLKHRVNSMILLKKEISFLPLTPTTIRFLRLVSISRNGSVDPINPRALAISEVINKSSVLTSSLKMMLLAVLPLRPTMKHLEFMSMGNKLLSSTARPLKFRSASGSRRMDLSETTAQSLLFTVLLSLGSMLIIRKAIRGPRLRRLSSMRKTWSRLRMITGIRSR